MATLHARHVAPTSKQELRQWALKERARVREGGAELDDALVRAIRLSPAYQAASTVGAYLALGSEIDLSLLYEDDKRFVIPRTHQRPERHLTFHELVGARIVARSWGLREPASATPVVPLEEIELLLVPGLLFDRAGYRLGFGAGYYDRTLQRARLRGEPPTTAGVTLQALLLPRLPAEPHDVPMDHVVTEAGMRPAERAAVSP